MYMQIDCTIPDLACNPTQLYLYHCTRGQSPLSLCILDQLEPHPSLQSYELKPRK